MWRQPYGFSWIVEGELAGMPRPAGPADFEFLKESGISLIITLTEEPLRPSVVSEYGFHYLHLPIPDFAPPTRDQIDRCVKAVRNAVRGGGAAVVHCFAGRGRTGTMAACYLVAGGIDAEEAIDEVRSRVPGAIETVEQENAVRLYAERLAPGER